MDQRLAFNPDAVSVKQLLKGYERGEKNDPFLHMCFQIS